MTFVPHSMFSTMQNKIVIMGRSFRMLRTTTTSSSTAMMIPRRRCGGGGSLGSVGGSFHYYTSNSTTERQKIALVLGSSGCLGRTIVQHLSNDLNMQVIGVDVETTTKTNDTTDDSSLSSFISVPPHSRGKPLSLADMTTSLYQGVSNSLLINNDDDDETTKLDVIICASGGWEGDPSPTENNIDDALAGAQAYGESIDHMMALNLYPVLSAGYIAQRFMGNDGLFVVIGATAALSSTPGMLGYGLSKSGAHHFVHTLGDSTGKSATNPATRKVAKRLQQQNEYLDTLSVIGILPTTIDTPTNRNAMPQSDFNTWTKPKDIAKEIGTWIDTPPLRPHSGSLVKVFPGNGKHSGAVFQLVR